MLTIRMQRTGRKGHAMFRIVVQDARQTPSSGKVVAQLGSYDPHAKTAVIDKDKVKHFLEHGAQPSERVARLLNSEGVKLPKWVNLSAPGSAKIRNPEKLRRNRVEEVPVPETAAENIAETENAEEKIEAPVEPVNEEPTDNADQKSEPSAGDSIDRLEGDTGVPTEAPPPEESNKDDEPAKTEKEESEPTENEPADEAK